MNKIERIVNKTMQGLSFTFLKDISDALHNLLKNYNDEIVSRDFPDEIASGL